MLIMGAGHTCLAMGGGQHVYSYVPWPALKMKRSWNEIFCTMCPSYNNGLSKCSIFVLTRQLIIGDLMIISNVSNQYVIHPKSTYVIHLAGVTILVHAGLY